MPTKARESHYSNADEVAAALKATPTQIVAVSGTSSPWTVGSAHFGQLSLWWGFQAARSSAMGVVPPGTTVIAMGSREDCSLNGQAYSSRIAAVLPPGAPYVWSLPSPDRFCFVSAPHGWLLSHADDELHERLDAREAATFQVGDVAAKARAALATARRLALHRPDVLRAADDRAAMEKSLLSAMFEALDISCAWTDRFDSRLARRVVEWLRSREDDAIYQEDVCAALCTSRRSLRRVFDRLFGSPPGTYLRMRRMHLARRALLTGDCASITETAVRFGFYDFGRFAGTYKLLFGELPSESLRSSARAWQRGGQRRR